MTFPAPVPEIPAANVDTAAAYYVNTLGFTIDWGDDQGGIAGISRGNCRLFITNRSFRKSHGNIGPILFWLNLDSKAEVDVAANPRPERVSEFSSNRKAIRTLRN